MFEAQKEWICPENFPDLKGYKYIAIDLETKDPDLKVRGSGAVIGNGNIVGITSDLKWGVTLSFIQNAKVEGDMFKMQKLYNEMTKRTSAAKSDFVNGMTKRFDKENMTITVNCNGFDTGSYTDRKWNGLFRGIDFSKFNIDKVLEEDRWGVKNATITITLKNESKD